MQGRRRRLPPLDYLVAFEAAARLGGFTAAGEQINLTQAAISRQIKLLEEHLGVSLFQRGHRSVQLTPEGKSFLRYVTEALDAVEKGVEGLHDRARRARVSLAATQSIATLWLMPRLPRLRLDHPDIDIRLVSTDLDREALTSEHDLIILRGEGTWEKFSSERLLDEEIFPVCAPDYAEQMGLHRLEALLDCTLINVASHHTEWTDWARWLAASNLRETSGAASLTFNTYALAVQAAIDSLGVALGWRYLVDGHLAQGTLVRPLPNSIRTRSGYFLLQPQNRPLSDATEAVRNWLFEEAGTSPVPELSTLPEPAPAQPGPENSSSN
ncbi:LysR substrate-binding domain-containing protein [Aquamicrobium zhengzhouense]|uniref:LysR family transcriptional regulator n=1 Tax=Aquamicrobium zhengzhouense TaxID=2781738 RepID=A0ABS0SC44_9HYPH|nr:LysR substrate-binding domain-containing protein [Aquamicrobium zhengzhouense]MBI1620200.1 LysR family transcriptional regulator [Aquamicrobium zhengzhouense]